MSSSSQPNMVLNESAEVVIRDVLKQAAERSPDLERALLWCAVPRWFDAEIINGMLISQNEPLVSIDEIIQYLSSLPFSGPHPTRDHTWTFREESRAHLLKHKAVTDHQNELQLRAADLFKKRFDAKASEGERKFNDLGLKDFAIEYVYHLHQLDPPKALKAVRQICAETLAVLTSSGGRSEVVFCSRFLGGLDWPSSSEQIEQDLSFLRAGISALLTGNDVKALQMLYELVEVSGLTAEQRSSLHDWVGEIHLWNEERLGPALEQFKIAERLTPNDTLVNVRIAEVYYTPGPTWGRFDLADQYARKAVALVPDGIDGYVAIAGYLALGNIAKLQENYDEALGVYQKVIDAEPNTFNAYLSQSEVYSARGELIRSLDAIDEALKVSPDIKYYALVRRGNTYRDARRYEEAINEYNQARDEAPDRVDAYIGVGGVQAILWQVAEAEETYHKAIELKPEAGDGYAALARLYEQQGKLEQAIDVCLEAIKKGIDSKDLYIRMSDSYRQQSRLADLQQAQKKLVQIDPAEEYAAHCALGDAWLAKAWRRCDDQSREQWLTEAHNQYNKALANDPQRAWAHLSLARLAVLQHDENRIQEQKRQVNEHSSWALYEMLVTLGRAYLENFQYAKAEKELRTAVELAPRRKSGWQALSELYHQQCNSADVVATWSKLVEIDPTLAYDSHMHAGDAYQRSADYARARAEYIKAKEIQSETYGAYWALAETAEAESKWDEAIANYRLVMSKAPGLAPIASVGIARILLSQEKPDEAEEAVRTAIRQDSEAPLGYIELGRLGVIKREEELVTESRQLLGSVSADRLYDFDCAIGNEYRLARQYEKAEQSYRDSIRRDPERAEAYIGLGKLRLSQERPQGAEEWLPQALKIDRTNLEANLALAEMYEKLGRDDEAEQVLKTAIDLSPWQTDAYLFLGSLLHRRGNSEGARNAYEKAKDAAGVSYFDLGSYYELKRKLDDAVEVYRIGLEYESEEQKPAFHMALASLYARLNNFEQANTEYRQAIDLDPTRQDPYVRQAQLLSDAKRVSEAFEVYEEMSKQPDLAYAAKILKGNLLEEHEKSDEAEQSYLQAIELNEKELNAYVQLASLYLQKGKLEETEQILHRASVAIPNNPEPLRLLAQLREKQGSLDEAMQLYRRVVELQPVGASASEAHQQLGSLLTRMKRYDEVERELQQAVQSDAANAEAHYNLGAFYEQQGKLEPALESYTKATALVPMYRDAFVASLSIYASLKDQKKLAETAQRILELELQPTEKYDAYLVIGDAYRFAADTVQAAKIFRQAIELDPKGQDAYVRLAQLLADENRVDEALEVCRRMARQPELAYVGHMSIGNLLLGQEKHAEAAQSYQEAIQVNPKQADAYLQLALLQYQQGKMDEAERLLLKATEMAPENPDPPRLMAELREQQQRWDEAIKLYRRVLELQPSGVSASEAYQRIGTLLVAQSRYGDAEQELEHAKQNDPGNADIYYSLGGVYEKQGNVERALESYTKATEIAPKHGNAYRALGMVYAKKGDIKKLEEMAHHILELDLDPAERYEAYLLISNAYRVAELYELAINNLNEAVSLDPKRFDAYFALGGIYEIQQRWAKARDQYEKIGELDPESETNMRLKLGQLFVSEQNPEDAEKQFRQVKVENLESNDRGFEILTAGYLNAASIYRKQGKPEAMRKACAEVVSLVKELPSPAHNAVRQLGLAHLMCGNSGEAAQVLHRALETEPTDVKARLYLAVNSLLQGEHDQAQSELKHANAQAQHGSDYTYAIEEAEVLAARLPEVAGAKEMLKALHEARQKFAE